MIVICGPVNIAVVRGPARHGPGPSGQAAITLPVPGHRHSQGCTIAADPGCCLPGYIGAGSQLGNYRRHDPEFGRCRVTGSVVLAALELCRVFGISRRDSHITAFANAA